ncbi:MAG: YjjG family noncanonical pyrimidine nucleotidase [Anaerolineae bacterium]|nr:YjjG family noncanonical pyrimidine nucleotidase [Anaerolineae bacterium]
MPILGPGAQRLGNAMTYRWLLFDADGTLFDYDQAEKSALSATCEAFSLPYTGTTLQNYREINDQMWRDFELGKVSQTQLKIERFQRLLDAIGTNSLDPAIFSHQYLHNLANCAVLIPHAENVIQALHTNVHLALITNGLKEVQRSRLAKSTIGHYFEAILISDELGVAKPDPGIFDAAFCAMGNPDKSHVMIIGDSLSSDIQGGSSYGIDTCWYNPTRKPRDTQARIDYEVQDLREILSLI